MSEGRCGTCHQWYHAGAMLELQSSGVARWLVSLQYVAVAKSGVEQFR